MQIRSVYLIAAALSVITLASCGEAGRQHTAASFPKNEESIAADSSGENNVMALNDPDRKLIHTADINCRVKDVYNATASLEAMVHSVGGQVMESRLENRRSEMHMQPYTNDSLRQVQEYTTTSHLTVRVPVSHLDTVLHAVAANADFIESRNLELQDVTFQYIGNKMLNKGAADLTDDALKRSKKTSDVMQVSEYADERKALEINRSVENMEIDDKVSYATFTVDLAQPARVDVLIVPDTEQLMQPGLGQRLKQAVHSSVMILQSLLVFIVTIWPLLLIIALLFGTIRYFSRRQQWRTLRRQ